MNDRLQLGGTYRVLVERGATRFTLSAHNLLTWGGVDQVLAHGLDSKTWVIGFKKGGEGSVFDTPASRVWTESPHNPEGSLPLWTPARAGAGLFSNQAGAPRVVVTQDLQTDGVFIRSLDGAVLLSVAEWYATQDLLVGDALTITYELEAAL